MCNLWLEIGRPICKFSRSPCGFLEKGEDLKGTHSGAFIAWPPAVFSLRLKLHAMSQNSCNTFYYSEGLRRQLAFSRLFLEMHLLSSQALPIWLGGWVTSFQVSFDTYFLASQSCKFGGTCLRMGGSGTWAVLATSSLVMRVGMIAPESRWFFFLNQERLMCEPEDIIYRHLTLKQMLWSFVKTVAISPNALYYTCDDYFLENNKSCSLE